MVLCLNRSLYILGDEGRINWSEFN